MGNAGRLDDWILKSSSFKKAAQCKRRVAELIVRNRVDRPDEGNGKEHKASRLQNASNLPEHGFWIRTVFQHLGKQDTVHACVLQRNPLSVPRQLRALVNVVWKIEADVVRCLGRRCKE